MYSFFSGLQVQQFYVERINTECFFSKNGGLRELYPTFRELMSLLQLIIILTGAIFLLFAIDLYQRKKFNLLHFLVFFGGTGLVVLFVLRQDLLNKFGSFFGGARGADVIVYLAVIFLGYMYFEVINKQTKQQLEVTKLCIAHALREYERDMSIGAYP